MNELGPLSISLVAENVSKVVSDFQNMANRLSAIEKQIADSSVRASRTKLTEAEKAEKERLKAAQKTAKETAKAEKEAAKAAEKAQKEVTKAAEVEANRREMIVRNFALMAGRYAKQQADQEIREAKRAAAERTALAQKVVAGRQALAQKIAGGVGSSIVSDLGKVTRLAGMALSIGGGVGFAETISHLMSVQKLAAQVAVSSRVDPRLTGGVDQQVTQEQALQASRHISQQSNLDEAEVLEGLRSFIAKTGMGKKGLDVMGEVAHIGKAEGIDVKELGNSMGIAVAQNPHMNNEEMVNLLRLLVGQGKLGAVEMSDMANVLPVAMASAPMFEGGQFANQAKLATLLQFGIKTTGSPEQAATAIKHLSADAIEHQKAFAAAGIQVKGEHGLVMDPFQLIQQAISKTGGDPFKLHKMFGERVLPLISSFVGTYREAEKVQKGSGAAALDAAMSDMATKTNVTSEQVERDYKTQMTAGERMEGAFRRIRDGLEEKLAPVLESLADKLTPAFIDQLVGGMQKLLDSVMRIVGWVSEHPKSALALAAGYEVGKPLLGMGAQALSFGMMKSLLGAGGGATAAEGVAGTSVAGGAAGLAAPLAAAAVGIGLLGYAEHEAVQSQREQSTAQGKSEAQMDLDELAARKKAVDERKEMPNADPEITKLMQRKYDEQLQLITKKRAEYQGFITDEGNKDVGALGMSDSFHKSNNQMVVAQQYLKDTVLQTHNPLDDVRLEDALGPPGQMNRSQPLLMTYGPGKQVMDKKTGVFTDWTTWDPNKHDAVNPDKVVGNFHNKADAERLVAQTNAIKSTNDFSVALNAATEAVNKLVNASDNKHGSPGSPTDKTKV